MSWVVLDLRFLAQVRLVVHSKAGVLVSYQACRQKIIMQMHAAHVNLLTYSKFHTFTQHTWMVNVGHTGRCAAKSRGIQRHSMRHQGFAVSQAILKQS